MHWGDDDDDTVDDRTTINSSHVLLTVLGLAVLIGFGLYFKKIYLNKDLQCKQISFGVNVVTVYFKKPYYYRSGKGISIYRNIESQNGSTTEVLAVSITPSPAAATEGLRMGTAGETTGFYKAAWFLGEPAARADVLTNTGETRIYFEAPLTDSNVHIDISGDLYNGSASSSMHKIVESIAKDTQSENLYYPEVDNCSKW